MYQIFDLLVLKMFFFLSRVRIKLFFNSFFDFFNIFILKCEIS